MIDSVDLKHAHLWNAGLSVVGRAIDPIIISLFSSIIYGTLNDVLCCNCKFTVVCIHTPQSTPDGDYGFPAEFQTPKKWRLDFTKHDQPHAVSLVRTLSLVGL